MRQLQLDLRRYQHANDAYHAWEMSAKAELAEDKETQKQLADNIIDLRAEVAQWRANNAELLRQRNALDAENTDLHSTTVTFREELWHSEMRWRDAMQKNEQLEQKLRTVEAKAQGP